MIKSFENILAAMMLDVVCLAVSDRDALPQSDAGSGRSDGGQDPQCVLERGPRSHLGPSSLVTISSKRQSSLCILRGCSLKRVVPSVPRVVDGGVRPGSGAGDYCLEGLTQGSPLPSKAGGGRQQKVGILLPCFPPIFGLCVTM